MPSYEEIVDDLVHRHPHVKAKKMFGMDGFTANGKPRAASPARTWSSS